jgi:hypothetical protein
MKFIGKKSRDKATQIPFNLPVNHETIFSNNKHVFKKRIEHRQRSLLNRLSFLKPFLEEGEEIFLITTGCSPVTFSERFWTGLNVFQLKCSLLVFTNRRVFHVPTTKHHFYRNSIAHFYYADCISIGIKGLTLIVRYKNGRKEKFHHIAVREEKRLKVLLKSISLEGTAGPTQGRIHLCPRCTKELDEARFVCENCGLEFKDKARARKISILFPGAGYFYARHPFLGLADAAIEMILLGMFILSLIGGLKGIKYSELGLYIFPFALLFEKALTVYHSNNLINEFIPKEKEIKILSAGKSEEEGCKAEIDQEP